MSGEAEPLWGAANQDSCRPHRSTASASSTALISKEALNSSLRTLLTSSAKRITDLLKERDTDGSGEIDVDEFREAVKSLARAWAAAAARAANWAASARASVRAASCAAGDGAEGSSSDGNRLGSGVERGCAFG